KHRLYCRACCHRDCECVGDAVVGFDRVRRPPSRCCCCLFCPRIRNTPGRTGNDSLSTETAISDSAVDIRRGPDTITLSSDLLAFLSAGARVSPLLHFVRTRLDLVDEFKRPKVINCSNSGGSGVWRPRFYLFLSMDRSGCVVDLRPYTLAYRAQGGSTASAHSSAGYWSDCCSCVGCLLLDAFTQ